MLNSKPEYFVSTDSIGFFGNPNQFLKLWKEYFTDKTLDGVEIVAFKPISRLKKIIVTLKNNHIPAISFHGKTGGENQLNFPGNFIMALVNFFICDIQTLLKHFPEIEFLSHTPHLQKNSIKEIIFQNKPKKIWIENHLHGKNGVEDTIKQILIYRKQGINACGMLDVFHYIVHSTENLKKDWPKIVEELKLYFLLKDDQNKPLFYGIHFPIGTRLGDSLPIDQMTDEMLELFAQKIIPLIKRVVFENQQKNLGLFFSTNKMIEEQKTRNIKIIKRLKKTGLILPL